MKSVKSHILNLKQIYSKIWKNKLLCLIYILIVLVILIITLKHHHKQDIENFTDIEFKNKHVQYSKCKKECVVKYEDPDQAKTCKKYCKCKKKCATSLNNKKCLKGCKDIKMKIYGEDHPKYQKLKIKKEIKLEEKKQRKEKKIEERREEKAKEKEQKMEQTQKNNKAAGFLVNVMNNYASEKDRLFILNLSSSTGRLYKDIRNAFRFK